MAEGLGPRRGWNRAISLDGRTAAPRGTVYENPLAEDATHSMNPQVGRQVSAPAPQRSGPNANTSTLESAKKLVQNTASNFFCVNEEEEDDEKKLWQERRMRLLSRRCGKLKGDACDSAYLTYTKREQHQAPVDGEDVTDSGEGTVYDMAEPLAPGVECTPICKEPVYKLTFKGLSHVTGSLKKKLTGVRGKGDSKLSPPSRADVTDGDDVFEPVDPDDNFFLPGPSGSQVDGRHHRQLSSISSSVFTPSLIAGNKPPAPTWNVRDRKFTDGGIPSTLIETILDNSTRRVYGVGWIGQLFDRQIKKDLTKEQLEAIDHLDDHRPFFTYFVTTAQIIILLISIILYGLGPYGFTRTQKQGLVLVPSLSLQQVDYYEADNFWIGPRAADLIHLGAKYAPCMRRDKLVYDHILRERDEERDTACCIRNDRSGCVQSRKDKCSSLLSSWHKWGDPKGPIAPFMRGNGGARTSGTVCGQDPRGCIQPPSQYPYEWPDDITKWPVCTSTRVVENPGIGKDDHMTCEVIGKPCCFGIHGECKITTQEYCEFVKGFFHEEASLCSQVSCMKDVCGMIPFYSDDKPDQFYRLFASLFLHAGILHLAVTLIIQYFIMRDIEKLAGSLRIGIIYIASGVAGNWMSAIFVPYRAEVGPAGSQFGMLACLIVEVINSWSILEKPATALARLCSIAVVLFLLGFLPWVDNYAHIAGFLVGFALSLAILPYVTIGTHHERRIKLYTIYVSLSAVALIFVALFIIFYIYPVYDCDFCKYLNCFPLTDNWCADQGIHIKRTDVL